MPDNLTQLQIATALAEDSYRRSSSDQALSLSDIAPGAANLGLSGPSESDLTQMGMTSDGGYWYDDFTGFVGRVVNVNNTIYVTFRGTDMSGGGSDLATALLQAIAAGPVSGVAALLGNSSIDWRDFADANFPLALGTTAGTLLDANLQPVAPSQAATQLDDALALTQAAIASAGGLPVVVVGQSLGGGLAGLVSAILNLPSYLIDPAPFANQLTVLATEAAFAKNGVPLIDPFGAVNPLTGGTEPTGISASTLELSDAARKGVAQIGVPGRQYRSAYCRPRRQSRYIAGTVADERFDLPGRRRGLDERTHRISA